MKYIFISNGREDKAAMKNEIEGQIKALESPIDYEFYLTKSQGDATSFIKGYCLSHVEEETCFVACGGDGTINEVVSGIVGASKKYFGVIALGTGNDFVKYYKGKDFKSVKALVEGTASPIDILKVNDRYSVNVCNFGFDSIVGSTGAKLSTRGWKNPYRWGIVDAIIRGRFNRIKVSVDGEPLNKNVLLLCTIANCHYVGGEFFCAPRAKNNDGLADVCLIKCMTLFQFLGILPVYTAGKHLDDPKQSKKCIYRQGKHIEFHSTKVIEACLDGEMLPGTDFIVDVIPGALNFVIPA